MLKVFGFLTRKAGMEMQAFIDHYENNHVPLILSLASVPTIYKRNYLVKGHALNLDDGTTTFDCVTELVFQDRAAFETWLGHVSGPGAGEQVAADEERFLDRSKTRAFVIEEHVTAG